MDLTCIPENDIKLFDALKTFAPTSNFVYLKFTPENSKVTTLRMVARKAKLPVAVVLARLVAHSTFVNSDDWLFKLTHEIDGEVMLNPSKYTPSVLMYNGVDNINSIAMAL